ncbi:MAG: hypothetical protein JNK47_08160 [Mesorhizobium sp.]|nr:hypothetical protein [Mesorhizobium sp.]MBL8577185.1 hypothetical protein [Mesorhizobium sp.]
MLKTALVALTIVGCDCDAKVCEFVSETPAKWASVAECEAEMKAQVIRAPGVDYPLVTGICRAVPGTDKPEEAETATASLEKEEGRSLYNTVVARGGDVLQKTSDGYGFVKAGVAWTAARVTPSALVAWLPGIE